MRQSAATVEAGKRAGIRQVINLQEPIAAGLAYANMAVADAQQEALSARQKRSESALKAAIEQINSIRWSNLWRTPEFLIQMFEDLSHNYYSQFSNPGMADAYIRSGRQAISGQDWMRLPFSATPTKIKPPSLRFAIPMIVLRSRHRSTGHGCDSLKSSHACSWHRLRARATRSLRSA
jgi:hypothetical protein